MRVRTDDAGLVGGMEALALGFLLFVAGTLVVLNAWAVIDTKLATTAAAREAARTFVEASSETPVAAARTAAFEAIDGHGRDPRRADLVPSTNQLRRCDRVTMEVRYKLPLVAIPVLGLLGREITVSARHSEIVDPFRSGLSDTSQCSLP